MRRTVDKKPPMLPLRAQLCFRRSDALTRTLPAKSRRMSRQELGAMIWTHRAWDALHNDAEREPTAIEPEGATGYDADAEMPF